MPADSEASAPPPVALPHTWRPFGVRVALLLVGTVLTVLVVAVWIGIGADIRSQFTPFQRATMVVVAILLFITYYAPRRVAAVGVGPAGTQVVVMVVRDDDAGTVAAAARRLVDELLAVGDGEVEVLPVVGDPGARAVTAHSLPFMSPRAMIVRCTSEAPS